MSDAAPKLRLCPGLHGWAAHGSVRGPVHGAAPKLGAKLN